VTPEPVTLRAQTTTALTLTVAQPLSPLWSIFENYRIRDLGVDVASLKRQAAHRDTAFQVTEAYFRVLQAERLVEVAKASVAQLKTQVDRARTFEAHGVMGRNDVLRAELGMASAEQRRIQSEGGVTLARGRLALLLGFPPSQALKVVEPGKSEDALPDSPTPAEVAQLALAERSEIRELSTRVEQARTGHRAAWSRMVPQVSAIASYQRNDGSSLSQPEAMFVGLNATWEVWEWGATYFGIREAGTRVHQAMAAERKVKDAIQLDAQAAAIGYQTSREALAVAEKSLAQAEENFRLVTKRYETSVATTFDVIDAESLVTQARAQLSTALYDSRIARAAIVRAIGRIPGAGSKR
jgi:outer membrane protein